LDGFYGDTAATVAIGKISNTAQDLLRVALESLRKGIEAVKPGGRIGDIGQAIQSCVEPQGYSVVRDFVGHGIGRFFHEEPQVPHYGRKNVGLRLKPGMTFTIEPMINEGRWEAKILSDNWTAVTIDGGLSAQYEHTLAVTKEGVDILTLPEGAEGFTIPGNYVIGRSGERR
jgi:methionyl aminopeptidase